MKERGRGVGNRVAFSGPGPKYAVTAVQSLGRLRADMGNRSTRARRVGGTSLLLLAALLSTSGSLAARQGDADGAPDEGSSAAACRFPCDLHGALVLRYRYRSGAEETDSDLYATLDLDFGNPEQDQVSGRLSANAAVTIGEREEGRSELFGLQDTYSGSTLDHVYEAYLDVHTWDALRTLRVGRQQSYETPVFLWFDGLYVESEPCPEHGGFVGGYGGRPVHEYDSRRRSRDELYGLFAGAPLWEGGRARFDWLHLEDGSVLGYADDDLYELTCWQDVARGVDLEASYSRLGGESRDYRVRASAVDPEGGFTLRLSLYELLASQALRPLEINPFFTALGTLHPYRQAQVVGTKLVGDWLHLEGGADLRRVEDDADLGPSNRDVDRYHVTGTVIGLGDEGLDLSLTGETWDGGSTETEAWGADLTQRVSDSLRASAGSYYSLYKYDELTGEERDHVRTYYLRARLKHSENLALRLLIEFEDNDYDDFQTVRLGLTWTF